MIRPSFEKTKEIAATGQYSVIPVSTEIYADMVTPVQVMNKLKNSSSHCFMLESAEDTRIGADTPFWALTLSWKSLA